jgi:hypothetical protein
MESMFTVHTALLVGHSLLRWPLLAWMMMCLSQAVGLRQDLVPVPSRQRKSLLVLLILFDVQVLLGLGLLAASPLVQAAWGQMGVAMKDPVQRFWALEHSLMMVVAAGLMHVGYSKAKRAEFAAIAAKATLLWQGLSLLLVLAAFPWPARAVGRALLPRL